MRAKGSVLILGASGLVGSYLLREAQRQEFLAVGTYRTQSLPGLRYCDSSNGPSLTALLSDHTPEAVIYVAGWTWVDGCERDQERAYRENALEPASVAEQCYNRGIHFTFFSSSYVFDGRTGPYCEDDLPRPINVYGSAKLEGEQRIQEACSGAALIVRVICVYGAELQQKNFAYQVWKALEAGKSITLPCDQLGNPTYAGDIARQLLPLVEQRASGIRHLAFGDPRCSRPDWARKLVAGFRAHGITAQEGFDIQEITTADLKQPALRPLQAGMISKYPLLTGTNFNVTVQEMLQEHHALQSTNPAQ